MEAYEEHKLVKQLLSEIKNLPPEEEEWQTKVTVLKKLVDHHVEEEKKYFLKLKQSSL